MPTSAPNLQSAGLYELADVAECYDGSRVVWYEPAGAAKLPSPLPAPAGFAYGRNILAYRLAPGAKLPATLGAGASTLYLLAAFTGYDGGHWSAYETAASAPLPSPPPVFAGASPASNVVAYRAGAPVVAAPAVAAAGLVAPVAAPAVPSLPALSRKVISPTAASRGDGIDMISLSASQSLANYHVEGYEQNLVAQGVPSLSLTNVRSVNAWRALATDLYRGQALYLDAIPGPIVISSYLALNNGYQAAGPGGAGAAWWEVNAYRHGMYCNMGASPPAIDTAIIIGHPACGVQFRNGGSITNSVIIGCGIGVLAVKGTTALGHVTILGGACHPANGYYFDGRNWTGNTALQAYYPIEATDLFIASQPCQASTPPLTAGVSPPPGLFPSGCLVSGGVWPPPTGETWTPPPAGTRLIQASGCVLRGAWPGPTFAGQSPSNGSGWALKPGAVAAYDPMPVINAVLANTLSIADAVAQLHAGIRAL